MSERTKPLSKEPPDKLPDLPARLERDDTLKKKIAAIIEGYPNKTISVIRRWLNNDQS